MAEYTDREHYIPVRRNELIDLLCNVEGVTPEQQKQWRIISNLLASLFHFEFLRIIEELAEDYAPFDPDRETTLLRSVSTMDRSIQLGKLFSTFSHMLIRANFHHVTEEELTAALQGRSRWGLSMDVDFGIFDRLSVYVRGKTTGKRSFRNWKRMWKMEEVEVPIYRRLVIMLKLREDSKTRIGPEVNSSGVYMKAFKDIPQEDMEMLLPGARLKMSNIDKTKLSFPLLTFFILTAWNAVIVPILKLVGLAFIKGPVGAGALGIWSLAAASGTYGYRSYYSYNFTRNQYSLQLTRSLYYQNLDNNAGVLYNLLNEAEHQEWREAILGYFCLWKFAPQEGWTAEQLDDFIEDFLEKQTGQIVDFEIHDSLAKLERFGLVTRHGDQIRIVPLEKAIDTLHEAWDKEFEKAIHGAESMENES
ncbi:MAG: DUF3754 domain-containing protein [Planctomycetia bacterium]|nr:DUF3754 domain-containing protein [Planctomycetia bacterium]